MTSRSLLALVVTAMIIGTGCTIPLQDEARAVDDVPPDFLATTSTTVEETVPPEDSSFKLALYFVNADSELVRVERDRNEPATAQDAVDALSQPPNDAEKEANPGIETRFLVGLDPKVGPRTEGGTVPIKVAGDELTKSALDGPSRVFLVYRQIVCTLVALDESIVAIQIDDDVGTIRVQTQDGSVVERPVTPDDVDGCKTAADLALEAVDAADDQGTSTTGG